MMNCAWCNKKIPDDHEAFGLGAKLRPGKDFSDREGKTISIFLSTADRSVSAIVSRRDSAAKRDGKDVMFVTCSRECANSLTSVLQLEIDIFDSISSL